MKRILIYGIGKQCEYYFLNDMWLSDMLSTNDYEIIGFLDGNKENEGKVVCCLGKEYIVQAKDDCIDMSYDCIIVTSKEYFVDIKDDLLEVGVKEEKIWLIDKVIDIFLENLYHMEYFQDKEGVEVGGPSAIFRNIYNGCKSCDGVNYSADTVWWEKGESTFYYYEGKVLGDIYIAEATELSQLSKGRYDFLLSSNNIEHIANPIKALKEFYKVLKSEGIMLLAVPNKVKIFDHNRPYTLFEHLVADYLGEIEEDDLTHLEEICKLHDYEMDEACGGPENFRKRANNNLENRCLHHHVFSESCLKKVCEYSGFKILDFFDVLDNHVIICQK